MKTQNFSPYSQAKISTKNHVKPQNVSFGASMPGSILDRFEVNLAVGTLKKFKGTFSEQLINKFYSGKIEIPAFAYNVISSIKDNTLSFLANNKKQVNSLLKSIQNSFKSGFEKNSEKIKEFVADFGGDVLKRVSKGLEHAELKGIIDGGADFATALLTDNKQELYKLKNNILNVSDKKMGTAVKNIALGFINAVKDKLFVTPDEVIGKGIKKGMVSTIDYIAGDNNKLFQNFAGSTFKTVSGSTKHEVKGMFLHNLKNFFCLN